MSARPEPDDLGTPAPPSTSPAPPPGRPDRLASTTVCIATYQRRGPVLRLLTELCTQVQQDPTLRDGLDVVVVVDGSTDGTAAALRDLDLPVPLTVVEQPNGGLASARNAGWRTARGEVVWFLDDDLVPAPGLLERHRRAHRPDEERVLVGPCVIPSAATTTDGAREWWQQRYAAIAAAGGPRFDEFSAANTSLPRAVLERLGGFDERFVGYGREDYELGLRLLDAGVRLDFDPEAQAVHHQHRSESESRRLRREEGRNVVRFTRLHPRRTADILRAPTPPAAVTALVRLLRRPALLALRPLATWAGSREVRRARFGRLLAELCFVTGVLEEDRDGPVVAALLWRATGWGRRAR